MAKTFEERLEELNEERNESEKRRGGDDDEFDIVAEAGIDIEDIDELADRLGRIALPTPGELGPDELGRERRQRELRIDILQELADQLGVDLSDLQETLIDEAQTNLDLDDASQLLQLIASFLQTQNQLLGVIANTNVSQLENIIAISNDVKPATLISVSGREVIDDPDTSQPVVPESDTTDIPTNTLFIRADENNSTPIAIGDDDVDPDDGFILKPGEAQEVSIDLRDEQLFMASETDGDAVRLLGLF